MAAAPRPTANTPTPTSGSDRAELVYQVLGNERFRPPQAGQDFSCTDLPRKRVRRKIRRPRCVIHSSSSSTEPRCGRRKNSVFGDSHPAFLSVYLEVRFPSFHLFSAPAPGSARRLRLELQAFRVLRKSAPLKKRNAAFVENFLRAFQLLRTAAQNHYLVQAWLVRVLHAFQSLRCPGKVASCRKPLHSFSICLESVCFWPFSFQSWSRLSHQIPARRGHSPCSSLRIALSKALFSFPTFWNVISHIRLPSDPPRSKLKRIARTARPKSLSHPPPPSCHKNPRICRNLLA